MPPAPFAWLRLRARSLTECYPLCHFVNVEVVCDPGGQDLDSATGFGICDQLAQTRRYYADHCSRSVISTAAPSRTPKASNPVLIWPNAMLNKVAATVADPISNGMVRSPFDFGLWTRCNA